MEKAKKEEKIKKCSRRQKNRILLTADGEKHVILKSDGKYFYCEKTRFLQNHPYIQSVEER